MDAHLHITRLKNLHLWKPRQERKESNLLKLVSSQSHNHYDFLDKILVKLLHNFVEVKL